MVGVEKLAKNLILVVLGLGALLLGMALNQSLRTDFETISGDGYRWQDLEGDWVVVNYFAEWCAPCLREIPELNAFYNEAKASESSVHVFGVSFDALPETELEQLTQKYEFAFPVVSTSEKNALKVQRPASLPTTYIINPQGMVVKTLQGELSEARLHQTLETLKRL